MGAAVSLVFFPLLAVLILLLTRRMLRQVDEYMRSVSTTRRLLRWIGNGLLVVLLVWTLVPFYWMVATSLKKDKEIYGFEATLIPRQPTLANYTRLFAATPFVKYLRNSTIIAVGTTVLSLVFGCLGAYALARLRFPAASSSPGGWSSPISCRRPCSSFRCSR